MSDRKPLLVIGGIDVSEYVLDGYEFSDTPVYDSSTSFTNMFGETIESCIGYKIAISCTLGEIPSSFEKQLRSACQSDKINVTFENPGETTAVFRRPRFTSVMVSEGYENTESTWDFKISLETNTLPIDGL